MTFWSVYKSSCVITPKEFARRTEKFVVDSRGRREAIDNEYSRLFETRDKAVLYARFLLDTRLRLAREKVEQVLADIQSFEARESLYYGISCEATVDPWLEDPSFK